MLDVIIVFLTLKYQRGLIMHKKLVLNVDQKTLNCVAKQDKINNGFDAKHVIKRLSGEIFTIKNIVKNIGSNCGLKRVTVSVNYANYLDTALLNLQALKDIGLTKNLKYIGITKKLNTSFTMEPIFIKMGA